MGRRRSLASQSRLIDPASALTPSCRWEQHSIILQPCSYDPAEGPLRPISLQHR